MRMPLPSFSWANGSDVWNSMLEKDTTYSKLKSSKMLERHPLLVDSYRTILFDWLSEVSHECKFHRETYHLALDLIDRYLSATSSVGKLQLQLIGTTCLHIAAKFEEIRPPSINEFAELTDGAVKVQEIIENEVVILSALSWDITPTTANNWLNVYMQILLNLDHESQEIYQSKDISDNILKVTNENLCNDPKKEFTLSTKNDSFILPATNGIFNSKYKRIASVIDLAMLHLDSLRFSNSILAASALYHFTDEQTVRQCTGYEYRDLFSCIHWLNPFVETINEIREPVFITSFNGETQSIQIHSHIATAKMLETVTTKMDLESTRVTLKRKIGNLTEDEFTEPDSILLTSTTTTSLLTPPKRESIKRTRRLH